MEKWEQQLKNDINCPMPSLINDRIEESLTKLPRKKRKRKIYYGLTVAIVSLLMIFGVSMISPTFANTLKEIPVIGSAFEFVGNIGVKKGKEEGLTTELGDQINVDGHLITFTDTLYDGGQIHIGYLIETERKKNNFPIHFLSNLEFLINGEPIEGYGMGGNEVEFKDGTYAGTINISVRQDVPDSFLLGIRPREKNSWYLELPIEKKGDNQSFLVNQTKDKEDLSIFYDKVTFFPTSTEISFRLLLNDKDFIENKYMLLDYQIIDDKGRVLQPFSSSGNSGPPKNGKVLFNFKQYYEPLKKIPKSLTIKPYFRDIQNSTPKIIKSKWAEEKLILSQGEIGHLIVFQKEVENGVTTFFFEVEGEDLYNQANAFWLEDITGNRYDPDHPAVRLDGTVNKYQITFSKIPDLNEMYITTVSMTSPNFLEELEVKINIK